jgi:hypothetical protein
MSLTITLRNISWKSGKPAPKLSDYHYEVFVNTCCIESGYVRGHDRADGWDGLMLLLGSEREVKERYNAPTPAPSRQPKVLLPTPARKHPSK